MNKDQKKILIERGGAKITTPLIKEQKNHHPLMNLLGIVNKK